MTKQDKIQKEIINNIISSKFKGICIAAMRSGKTRCVLQSIKSLAKNKEDINVLVMAPNVDIYDSWKIECDKINYHPNITYSTYKSSSKHIDLVYDFVVGDECHLIAPTENELENVATIAQNNKHCLLITGTLNDDTYNDIHSYTGLEIICNYSLTKAIEDGIVADYKIYIHSYNLDDTIKRERGTKKKWFSTDLKECNRLTKRVNSAQYEQNWSELKFAALNRMRFINSCDSLVKTVNTWQEKNKKTRYLLMCADSNISKKFNIPTYNSLSKTDENILKFKKGEINQLALVRKSTTGITYNNLNVVVITNIDSNSENLLQKLSRSLLLEGDQEKEAEIHIFVSSEQFQLKWLTKAYQPIPKEKIIW
jgi:superfamily II DNA or RNA helicase